MTKEVLPQPTPEKPDLPPSELDEQSASVRLRSAMLLWQGKERDRVKLGLGLSVPITFVLAVFVEATHLAGFYGRTWSNIILAVVAVAAPTAVFATLAWLHRRRIRASRSHLDAWAGQRGLHPVERLRVRDLAQTPLLSGESSLWSIFAWAPDEPETRYDHVAILGRRRLDRAAGVERVDGVTVVSASIPPAAVEELPAVAVFLEPSLVSAGTPGDRCRIYLDREADRVRAAQLLSPDFLEWIESQSQLAWEQRQSELLVYVEELANTPSELNALIDRALEIRSRYITSM